MNDWVLVIVAAPASCWASCCGLLGWRFYKRKASAKAAFLWCLPVAPVLLTICVLGVTYL